MAQSNIQNVPLSFYGFPTSPADFPNGLSPCNCKKKYEKLCNNACKSYNFQIKNMLFHMHTAISELGLWEHFVKEPPTENGFMFSDSKWICNISLHPLVYDDLHSGGSFATTMRFMEYIAINGWDAFIKNWTIPENSSTINNEPFTVTIDT